MSWKRFVYLLPVLALAGGWANARHRGAAEPAAQKTAAVEKHSPPPVIVLPSMEALPKPVMPEPAVPQSEQPIYILGSWQQPAYTELVRLAALDPGAVVPMIDDLAEADRPPAIYAVAASWGSVDPQAALAWLGGMGDGIVKNRALGALICSWSGIDSSAAYDHLMGLTETQRRAVALLPFDIFASQPLSNHNKLRVGSGSTVCDVLIEEFDAGRPEREALLVMLESSEEPASQHRALRRRVDNLMAIDPAAALELGKKLEMFESGAQNRMLLEYARENPQAAVNIARSTGRAIDLAFRGWTLVDPEAAKEAIEALPAEEKSEALRAWGWVVGQSDPERAAAVFADPIDGESASEQRVFVETWFKSDPTSASRWAATLTPEQGRIRLLKTLYGQWNSRDPSESYKRLLGAGFTEEDFAKTGYSFR